MKKIFICYSKKRANLDGKGQQGFLWEIPPQKTARMIVNYRLPANLKTTIYFRIGSEPEKLKTKKQNRIRLPIKLPKYERSEFEKINTISERSELLMIYCL